MVLHGISDALALRHENWKFIPANAKGQVTNIGSGANPSEARFSANRVPQPLLFDLSKDPNEQTNVFAQFPKQAAHMQKLLTIIKAQKSE